MSRRPYSDATFVRDLVAIGAALCLSAAMGAAAAWLGF
jgi:hypothetical protein